MKITKGQKKFIKAKYKELPVQEIAKRTNLSEQTIKAYLKKLGKDTKVHTYKKAVKNIEVNIHSWHKMREFLKANLDFITLLSILCVIAYANTLNGEFISDDIPGFLNNPIIKSFPTEIKHLNLQNIIYSVSHGIFGLAPQPLHMLSIVLHIVNTILFMVLVSMVFGKRVSMLASMLFAVHPVNTETIAWISAINYLTNGTTFLVTAIAYVWHKNAKPHKYPIGPILLFTSIILISRNPWSLVIPPIIILIDQFFLERHINVNSLKKVSPFLLTIPVFYLMLKNVLAGKLELTGTLAGETEPVYKTAPYTIYKTFELLLYPKDLTLYHEGEQISQLFYSAMIAASIAILALIIYFWKKNRRIAGLLLIIIASIGPTFSPWQVAWYIAERYLYIASMAFGIILAFVFLEIEKKTRSKPTILVLVTLILIAYTGRAIIRNGDWHTRKSLWEATSNTSPYSARVHNNLGDVYSLEKDYDRAITEFQIAIQINPQYSEAVHNLGYAYMQKNDFEEAKMYLQRSYEMNPALYQALYKLGTIEQREGNKDKAEEYFKQVLEINPAMVAAQESLEMLKQN